MSLRPESWRRGKKIIKDVQGSGVSKTRFTKEWGLEDPTFTPICKLVGEIQNRSPPCDPKQKTYFGTVVTYDILDQLRGDEVAKTVIQRQGMALRTGEVKQRSELQQIPKAWLWASKEMDLTHTVAGMLKERLSKVSYLRGLWKRKKHWTPSEHCPTSRQTGKDGEAPPLPCPSLPFWWIPE